jgi:N-methylhydantoinase B
MDPVLLEIMKNAFTFVPQEMGTVLRRTAYSPNIKERMDASCAIFDSEGRMIAQAEHIPVHLGSMPLAIKYTQQYFEGDLAPGDQIVVNDPYHGGSHLNDITMVKPIFNKNELLGYCVNKAHHADVGGPTPGSMPSQSRTLDEEGIVIKPVKLLNKGEENDEIFSLVENRMRNPKERLGDLRAQIAANETGAKRFLYLLDKNEKDDYREFVEAILNYSETRVRNAIRNVPNGRYSAQDVMDDDGISNAPVKIVANVEINAENIGIDFSGTESQVEGNINAPYAVSLSSVYYVLRCITDPHAPPNEGCIRPYEVQIPKGSLLNPNPPAAVSAGNVETSQRIVDVLFLALAEALPEKIPAQSQGTMNNLLIGNSEFTYYETIAGGEGALSFRDGQCGIHTHMTNTKNTPIEALETAYPLRVKAYELIPGTGGEGKHYGGLGVRRAVRFLGEEGTLSIISDRRKFPPKGLFNGEKGELGKNYIVQDEETIKLPSKSTIPVNKGDLVVVETPGGGGWGHSPQ